MHIIVRVFGTVSVVNTSESYVCLKVKQALSYPRHLPDSIVGAWTAAATNGSPQFTVVMVLVVEVVLVSCVQNFRDGPPRMYSTAGSTSILLLHRSSATAS